MKEEISPQQSLEIINNIISKTKENVQQHSFAFILWGWLVGSVSLIHYSLVQYTTIPNTWYIWPIAMTGGALFSFYYYYRKDKIAPYKTHLEENLSILWQSIFIAFGLAIYISYQLHISITCLMLGFSAVGTMATGRSIRFKPLIWGGVCLFFCAALSLHIKGPENLLINALGIFTGYVIPGHLLRKK